MHTGYDVRNEILHLFCDVKTWIQHISTWPFPKIVPTEVMYVLNNFLTKKVNQPSDPFGKL